MPMPVLEIVKVPHAVLRERAKPITRITDATRRLIADMIETMKDAPGVGLAAPQVGISQRLFVYDVGEGAGAVLNPEIVERSGTEVGVEGCLSIPRLEGDVERAARVVVTGLDARGKRIRIEADELLARVFQHEIDHLDGILFTDRAIQNTLHWVTPEEEEERDRRREGRRRRGAREPAPAG